MNTKEGKLFNLEQAQIVSNDIINELSPFCDRISIAGLIRLERAHIDHLTFVCIPKLIDGSTDLFGDEETRVEGFTNTINQWEKVKGDSGSGKYTQRIHPSGAKVNIYMVCKTNWGLHLVMRTGPLIHWKRIVDIELRKTGHFSLGGFVRKIGTGVIIPIYEEGDLYQLIGEPMVLSPLRL